MSHFTLHLHSHCTNQHFTLHLQRSRHEKEVRNKYEQEYLNKVNTMDINIDQDITDTLEESELMFSERMKKDLEQRRQMGGKNKDCS